MSEDKQLTRALKALYTDEYRDKHWKKCRFSDDPRTCGSLHHVWKGKEGQICGRDSKDCDAEWTGDKNGKNCE